MKKDLLIYGCYGYTGQLISRYAIQCGLKPVLSGRDEAKTKALAEELNCEYRVFDLSDISIIVKNIEDCKIVLHCAGPFIYTALPMVKSCIKAKAHYLDITGEVEVFESIFKLDSEARMHGVMLMPGTGFDVVPSDCLAAYLKSELTSADKLEMALLNKGGRISHGTANTVAENMAEGCMVRKDGKLVPMPAGHLVRDIAFAEGRRKFVAIKWGDISSAYRSTHIPNIAVYNHVSKNTINSMRWSNYLKPVLRLKLVKNYVKKQIKKRPAGPSDEERARAKSFIWGEVTNPMGGKKRAYLELPEGYTLTALTSVKIVQEILAKEPPHGAFTPAQVFGKDFILKIEGVSRKDL